MHVDFDGSPMPPWMPHATATMFSPRCEAIRFGCIRLDLDFRPCGGPKPKKKTKSWKKIETKKWRTILLIDSLAKRTAAGPTKAKSRKV